MRHTILTSFEHLPYFTIEGFRQIAGSDIDDAVHVRIALQRWRKAGHIIPLKKGVYMHRRFYELHRQEPEFLPAISAILLPQSYISLEYVLQRSGVLTEVTYPVTAITIKNSRTISNPLGTFVYRHIKPDLYRGFQIKKAFGVPYAEASLTKALFDYLYLRPMLADLTSERYDLAEDLRLNLGEFSAEQRAEFAQYVAASRKVKMRLILLNLEHHVWRP